MVSAEILQRNNIIHQMNSWELVREFVRSMSLELRDSSKEEAKFFILCEKGDARDCMVGSDNISTNVYRTAVDGYTTR